MRLRLVSACQNPEGDARKKDPDVRKPSGFETVATMDCERAVFENILKSVCKNCS